MSVSMFRPAASAPNPRSRHRARAMEAQMNATGKPEYSRFHDHAEGKADYCILGLSCYQRDLATLDVDSTVTMDP